ncbi:MAG TPA: HAD-IA family hydrolase [Dehalococcoidia bacterium]|nr:HAD-IA family hydrolase [Dehalococcoidia bacterium]
MDITSPVRAIIYDCGNTLLYAHPSIEEICRMLELEHGHRLDAKAFQNALPDWGAMYYRSIGGMYMSDVDVRAGWAEHYGAAVAQVLAVAPAEAVEVGGLIYDWFAHPARWTPYPDVVPTLAEAKRRGYIQGVVSDWGSDLHGILVGHDLTKYLDFVVASAVVRVAKPHSDLFAQALQRAGVAADEALYVGDSYVADVIGARTAGLRAVLIDREGKAPPVDCDVVRSLEEVLALAGACA